MQCDSPAALQQQVEEIRSILDAQYKATKPGLASTTETPTAGFSPASKAGGFIYNSRVYIQSCELNLCAKLEYRIKLLRISTVSIQREHKIITF